MSLFCFFSGRDRRFPPTFLHPSFFFFLFQFARFLHWGDLKVHDIVEARDHTLGRIRGFRYLFDEIRMSLFPAAVLELLQPNEKGELVLFPSMTSTVFTTFVSLLSLFFTAIFKQPPFHIIAN